MSMKSQDVNSANADFFKSCYTDLQEGPSCEEVNALGYAI